MNSPLTILSTKKLQPSLIEEAAAGGIQIIDRDFIAIELLKDDQLTEAITTSADTLVFTSANAVEGYLYNAEGTSRCHQIFCMEGRTREALKPLQNISSIITAKSAASLAMLIANERSLKHVTFICGNKRRDELPDLLNSYDISVQQIEVYRTTKTGQRISFDYKAVMFFSPSAAEAFFDYNTLPAEAVSFCIGGTTAAFVKSKTKNPVVIAEEVSRESVLQSIIQYFTALKNVHT